VPAFKPVSLKVVCVAPTLARNVKFVPLVLRSISNPVSFAPAVLVQARLICEVDVAIAARLDGAVGGRLVEVASSSIQF